MTRNLFTIICLLLLPFLGKSQFYQYFDGANTDPYNSLFVFIDSTQPNVWQVGRPQKTIFDSAATIPNVIVTDTINTYPVNDSSSFYVSYDPATVYWGIRAIRWLQKLDMDRGFDGGIVEFSLDSGNSWQNIFHNPYVYNLYGFDTANVDTLASGHYGFTGTDTVWRDVWLCFDYSFMSLYDTVLFRFTLRSDTVDSAKEGWMIDNMMMQRTFVHTVAKVSGSSDKINVFPTQTSGIVNIEAPKVQQFHIIERMQLTDIQGRVVKEYTNCPVKFYIDISDQPPGNYYLKVKTNLYSGTFPVFLVR